MALGKHSEDQHSSVWSSAVGSRDCNLVSMRALTVQYVASRLGRGGCGEYASEQKRDAGTARGRSQQNGAAHHNKAASSVAQSFGGVKRKSNVQRAGITFFGRVLRASPICSLRLWVRYRPMVWHLLLRRSSRCIGR